MNNTDKMYKELQQELMNMEVGEVNHYYLVSYDELIRLLRGTYIDLSDSIPEEIRKGHVTITMFHTLFNIEIFSEEDALIFTTWLPTTETSVIKILTECLTELNTPEEIQQEPTPIPTLYRFTQHYFGVPKNSTFSSTNGWLESDDPNMSLGSFITCTYWKDGKPEEMTFWVTKSQIKELIKKCILKEGPYNERQQVYLNVLKLYWRLSEEDRKDHFKLVYQDPSVSQYRYKMDEDVVISVPSKYAPYSDFIPSETVCQDNNRSPIVFKRDHELKDDSDSHDNNGCCSDLKTQIAEIREDVKLVRGLMVSRIGK